MNRRDFLGGALPFCLCAAGCRLGGDGAAGGRHGREKEFSLSGNGRLSLSWPGLAKPFRFWVVGDTHFALHDARDAARADCLARMAQWPAAKEPFEKMLTRAKEERPDLLVLVGDNISFPTLANVEYLKASLDGCGVPWTYVAGNHDWHFEGDAGSDFAQRDRWIRARLSPLYQGADPLMASRVTKGVRMVMIDNSVYHVTPEQLAFYEAEAGKGDPLCLCLHIPLWVPKGSPAACGSPAWGAAIDRNWQVERRERWSERQMPSTFAFRDAVLSTPNLVGVFAGHVHRLQVFRQAGQNLFTTPENGDGSFLDVTMRPAPDDLM